MNWSQQLISDIEDFLSRTSLTATRFGLLSINDGKLVSNLRDGKTVSLKTADRIREFMRDFGREDHQTSIDGDQPDVTEAKRAQKYV